MLSGLGFSPTCVQHSHIIQVLQLAPPVATMHQDAPWLQRVGNCGMCGPWHAGEGARRVLLSPLQEYAGEKNRKSKSSEFANRKPQSPQFASQSKKLKFLVFLTMRRAAQV